MGDKPAANGNEWTRRQVAEFRKRHPKYSLCAAMLEKVLKEAARTHAPMAIVQTRPKSIASFAEKCQRKKAKYADPVNQLTDLCGGRAIVHTADEVTAMSEFIERHFEIDEENSVDVSQRLKPAEFGYRSVHYIVRFKPGVFPTREVDVRIPAVLLDDKAFPNRRAEVQVRTILEHAWADIAHDRAYKSAFRIPAKLEREFAGAAAMLEGADKTFSRILEALKVYASSYGAYMTEEQMREEIRLLEIVLRHDPGNAGLAGRIGKMAIALGDWPKAVEVLDRHAASGNPALLRDLGVALCKMNKSRPASRGYKRGQSYLETACRPPFKDTDALASLAGTWKGIDDERERALYRRAFQLDPTDPYPLENYLDVEIAAARDLSIISLLGPVIDSAVARCLAQVEVGVNLPWAFYMMGKFRLLLNQPDPPYQSLVSYAKAVQLSPSPWMVETALRSLERLGKAAGELSEYEAARRLLLIGRAVRAGQKARAATHGVKGGDQGRGAGRNDALRSKTVEVRRAKESVLALATPGVPAIRGPVVIVVGGCSPSIERQMKAYRKLVLEGFADYHGTVIGGGTREGISGLVGEVGEAYRGTIRTIGYLPRLIPADATADKRFHETRKTGGSGFSPLEPLQNWIDILAGGHDPSEVKVLGINGGAIAAVEYRIALALGATVGVVAESGREGAKLLRDERWESSKRLIVLPADAMTIRAFIGSGASELPGEVRETLARQIHAAYCLSKQDSLKSDDPAMVGWDKLRDGLKESNAQQADHIFAKLREIGCTWRKARGKEVKLLEFSKKEVELLARMEHGRWNAERLLDGWTWGERKDSARKISPYLVSWSVLPEEIKEWDRQAVRNIPAFLGKIGLEIRRAKRPPERRAGE